MKEFISGLYHYLIQLAMWLPCHPFRRILCHLVMKDFNLTSAIYRNVDLRSPYRISVGANSNINKRCVIDGRGG